MQPQGLGPFEKTIPPGMFYLCFHEWIGLEFTKPGSDLYKQGVVYFPAGSGAGHFSFFRLSGDARDDHYGLYNTIRATEDYVHVNKIDNASTQGVQHLKDIRFLINEYGLPTSFDESTKYYDFEQYVVFNDIMA